MLDRLKAEAHSLGKPEWNPMLRYLAELHGRSTHQPRQPFRRPWEEIGPGYHLGPTWNSMTYWAARGCLCYGRSGAARRLLEAALDATASQFERTGTIWEFYHPLGGKPQGLRRKPHTKVNTHCRDYLGHNPLIAMARMWESAGDD